MLSDLFQLRPHFAHSADCLFYGIFFEASSVNYRDFEDLVTFKIFIRGYDNIRNVHIAKIALDKIAYYLVNFF